MLSASSTPTQKSFSNGGSGGGNNPGGGGGNNANNPSALVIPRTSFEQRDVGGPNATPTSSSSGLRNLSASAAGGGGGGVSFGPRGSSLNHAGSPAPGSFSTDLRSYTGGGGGGGGSGLIAAGLGMLPGSRAPSRAEAYGVAERSGSFAGGQSGLVGGLLLGEKIGGMGVNLSVTNLGGAGGGGVGGGVGGGGGGGAQLDQLTGTETDAALASMREQLSRELKIKEGSENMLEALNSKKAKQTKEQRARVEAELNSSNARIKELRLGIAEAQQHRQRLVPTTPTRSRTDGILFGGGTAGQAGKDGGMPLGGIAAAVGMGGVNITNLLANGGVRSPPSASRSGVGSDDATAAGGDEPTESPTYLLAEILQALEVEGLTPGYYISRANALVDLFKRHPTLKYDLVWSVFGLRMQIMLLSESMEVVAAGYRMVRYAISDVSSLKKIRSLNTDYLVVLSLTKERKAEVEREQALKFVRAFMDVKDGVREISRAVVRTIAAVAEHAEDRLRSICIETLAEILVRDPALLVASGGVQPISDALAEGSYKAPESLTTALLFVLDAPKRRMFLRPGYELEVIFSPYTDPLFATDLVLKQNAKAIATALRSWAGLMSLAMHDFRALRSLVASLSYPAAGARETIIDLLYSLLRIKPPAWATSFLAGRRLTTYGRVATLKSGGSSRAGMAYVEDDSGEQNFVEHYTALLLAVLIRCGLMPNLLRVTQDADSPALKRKTTLLIGEVLKLSARLLPPAWNSELQLLPELFAAATAFDKADHFVATGIVYQVSSVSKTLYRSAPSNYIPGGLPPSDAMNNLAALDDAKSGAPPAPLDDASYRQLLIDSGVLSSSNPSKWNWDIILRVIEGPLTNGKRLEEAVKASKFVKRIMSFYRPFKYKFSETKSTRNTLKYVRAGCSLMQSLLQSQEGIRYLADNKLLRQIAECLAQCDPTSGLTAQFPMFSKDRLQETLCSGYFPMLGTLSSSPRGLQMMDRWRMFNMMYHIVDLKQRPDLIRLLLANFDYSLQGHPRVLLSKALTAATKDIRIAATNALRKHAVRPRFVSVNAGVAGGGGGGGGGVGANNAANGNSNLATIPAGAAVDADSRWAIQLLVTQLYDPDIDVCAAAVRILEKASNAKSALEYIVECRPALDHLGEIGAPLLLRFLSTSIGYHYLDGLDYISNEMDDWFLGRNDSYVAVIEASLARAFSALPGYTHASDQDGNGNNGHAGHHHGHQRVSSIFGNSTGPTWGPGGYNAPDGEPEYFEDAYYAGGHSNQGWGGGGFGIVGAAGGGWGGGPGGGPGGGIGDPDFWSSHVPPHFYRELARTREGCRLLADKGHFDEFAATIRDHGMQSDDAELVTKVKGCMWAVGAVGSMELGAPFLESCDVVEHVVRIAQEHDLLSLRGTAFFVLGLVSRSLHGLEILSEQGWDANTTPLGKSLGYCLPSNLAKLFSLKPWHVHRPATIPLPSTQVTVSAADLPSVPPVPRDEEGAVVVLEPGADPRDHANSDRFAFWSNVPKLSADDAAHEVTNANADVSAVTVLRDGEPAPGPARPLNARGGISQAAAAAAAASAAVASGSMNATKPSSINLPPSSATYAFPRIPASRTKLPPNTVEASDRAARAFAYDADAALTQRVLDLVADLGNMVLYKTAMRDLTLLRRQKTLGFQKPDLLLLPIGPGGGPTATLARSSTPTPEARLFASTTMFRRVMAALEANHFRLPIRRALLELFDKSVLRSIVFGEDEEEDDTTGQEEEEDGDDDDADEADFEFAKPPPPRARPPPPPLPRWESTSTAAASSQQQQQKRGGATPTSATAPPWNRSDSNTSDELSDTASDDDDDGGGGAEDDDDEDLDMDMDTAAAAVLAQLARTSPQKQAAPPLHPPLSPGSAQQHHQAATTARPYSPSPLAAAGIIPSPSAGGPASSGASAAAGVSMMAGGGGGGGAGLRRGSASGAGVGAATARPRAYTAGASTANVPSLLRGMSRPGRDDEDEEDEEDEGEEEDDDDDDEEDLLDSSGDEQRTERQRSVSDPAELLGARGGLEAEEEEEEDDDDEEVGDRRRRRLHPHGHQHQHQLQPQHDRDQDRGPSPPPRSPARRRVGLLGAGGGDDVQAAVGARTAAAGGGGRARSPDKAGAVVVVEGAMI